MKFDRERFAAVVGSSFVLKAANDRSVEVELIEVTPLRESPHQVSFSMLFRLPADYSIEQGLYDLEHETLGATELFLVPIAPDPKGMRLEAIVNLLREQVSGSDD